MSQILDQIKERGQFDFSERLREGRFRDFFKRKAGMSLFKRGMTRKDVDIKIKIKNVNNDEKVRYLGSSIDGILDWEGSDHWGENGIGLISSDRTVLIDKVMSPGIHGITVGMSSDTPWQAEVNVQGVKVAKGKFDTDNPLTGVFLVFPRFRKDVQTPVIVRKLPGMVLGYRKTGYQTPESIEPENASIPRGGGGSPSPPEKTKETETTGGHERRARSGF